MSAVPEPAAQPGEAAVSNVTPIRRAAEAVVAGVNMAIPNITAPQDPNTALEDLRIPEELLADLFRDTADLGLRAESEEVTDPFNRAIARQVTVVRCRDRRVYLVRIPAFVLDEADKANLAAVSYLGTMFPAGTVITVLSPELKEGPHRAFRKMWETWEKSNRITVRWVQPRDFDTLKDLKFSASDVADVLYLTELLSTTGETCEAAEPVARHAVRVFYSYAHEDDEYREQLGTLLAPLVRSKDIEPWYDRNITAGADWENAIDENLETADIILLLVSRDFLASEYINGKELRRALERHTAREARVVPVIVRPAVWDNAPFASLQAIPKDGLAVTTWENADEAWADVLRALRKLIGELQAARSG